MKSLLLLLIITFNYIYPQQSIPQVDLNDICFSDSLHGCAVGDYGVILYTSDGGINWLESSNIPSINFNSAYFINTSKGYASSDNAVFQTNDWGQNWTQIASTEQQIWPITFIDSATGFVAGNQALISKTTDGGKNWETKNLIKGSSISIFSLGFVNRNVGWAAGGPFLSVTEDGGENWTIIDSSISHIIMDAKFTSSTNGYLAALDGIFKTTNQGKTWTNKYPGTFYSIFFINEQIGWAAGYGGIIIKTTDSGETWVLQSSKTNESLKSVYFININKGWIAGGWHTTILATSDGGDHWNTQFPSIEPVDIISIPKTTLNDISFSDSLHGCAVGNKGVILYTSDGGINWGEPSNLPSINFNSACLINTSKGYASSDNAIFQTNDGGQNWTQIASTTQQIWPITFTDTVTGFVAGNQALISKTIDGGKNWETKNLINGSRINLFSIGFVNSNVGWAAGSRGGAFLGVLFWTEDGGENWTVIDSSISPYIRDAKFTSISNGYLATLDGIFKTTNRGETWTNKYPGTFYSIFFINEQVGWAAEYGGNIVKTTDSGETWVEQASQTNDDLYSVFFIDGKKGWAAGGWHTTILSTSDGGDHWITQLSILTSVNNIKNNMPEEYKLYQNYPNPFNPNTTIQFSLPKRSYVVLKIFNILGKEISTLVSKELNPGVHKITWSAGDHPSGVYFYKIEAEGFTKTKKLILLK